jgi:hypothetical protein
MSLGLEDYGESERKRNRVVVAVVILVVFGLIGAGVYWFLNRSEESGSKSSEASLSLVENRRQALKEIAEEADRTPCVPAGGNHKQATGAIRESLMSLVASPKHAGPYLEQQLLGKARLELYRVDDREIYFSLPQSAVSGEPYAQALCRLVLNKSRVQIAKESEGKLMMGGRMLLKTPDRSLLLKTPLDNLRVDADTKLRFPFQHAVYSPTLDELHLLMANETIYGGPVEANADTPDYGQASVYNTGVLVTQPGEPSLHRFTTDLLKDIAASDPLAREKRIQRLADLVSREIALNPEEIPMKLAKRASEVLMTGEAYYTNRAVLLGSLLEQIREDYLFIYSKNFLAVAVKSGQFQVTNKYQVKWEGNTWLMIDTTRPGFRIGVDEPKMRPTLTRYVQRPRQNNVITNMETGSPLTFN